MKNFSQLLVKKAQDLGFDQIGWSNIELTEASLNFQSWLQHGFHGEMHYMESHGEKRWRPDLLVPGTVCVLTARMHYYNPLLVDAWQILNNSENAYISRYAVGRDYHKLMRKRLDQLANWIEAYINSSQSLENKNISNLSEVQKIFFDPPFGYRVFCDSAPVLERALAEKSGLGFIGKNTLLIDPKVGSYFFLGEIYISKFLDDLIYLNYLNKSDKSDKLDKLNWLDSLCDNNMSESVLDVAINKFGAESAQDILKHNHLIKLNEFNEFTGKYIPVQNIQDQKIKNHCGRCTKCLDICPTKAIVAPYQLDARRCISYLTIEYFGSIPVELRSHFGNRIYGCDDCQLVCPWNRFASATQEVDFYPRHKLDNVKLLELFMWSESEFYKKTEGSAIRRIGYVRWLRNIAIGLGNGDTHPAILNALIERGSHDHELVREHSIWALSQLKLKDR